MKPPRWTFAGDSRAWTVALGDVAVVTSSSQKSALGETYRRLIVQLNETIADLDDAELAATRLAAWSATVKGRAGEVAS